MYSLCIVFCTKCTVYVFLMLHNLLHKYELLFYGTLGKSLTRTDAQTVHFLQKSTWINCAQFVKTMISFLRLNFIRETIDPRHEIDFSCFLCLPIDMKSHFFVFVSTNWYKIPLWLGMILILYRSSYIQNLSVSSWCIKLWETPLKSIHYQKYTAQNATDYYQALFL